MGTLTVSSHFLKLGDIISFYLNIFISHAISEIQVTYKDISKVVISHNQKNMKWEIFNSY